MSDGSGPVSAPGGATNSTTIETSTSAAPKRHVVAEIAAITVCKAFKVETDRAEDASQPAATTCVLSDHGGTFFVSQVVNSNIDEQAKSPALSVEKWSFNGDSEPLLVAESSISLPEGDTKWRMFRSSNAVAGSEPTPKFGPPALQFGPNGSFLRVGARLLGPLRGTLPTQACIEKDQLSEEFWEQALFQGCTSVLCRRMAPRLQATATDAAEASRVEALKSRLELMRDHKAYRRAGRKSTRPGRKRIVYHSSSSDAAYQPDGESGSDAASLASFDEAASSSAESDSEAESFLLDFDEESQPEESLKSYAEASSETSDSDGFDRIDSDSQESSDNESLQSMDSDTEDGSEFNDLQVYETSADAAVDVTNPVHTRDRKRDYRYKFISCDNCDGFCMDGWYHCVVCKGNNFDLCDKCVEEGYWCLDKTHRLQNCDRDGVASIVPFKDFLLKSTMHVYEEENAEKKLMFDYESRLDDPLPSSEPVLHAERSLGAWPLSAKKLLIFTYDEHRSHTRFRLKPGLKRGRKTHVHLQFSPCGSLLYVASVEALRVRKKKVPKADKSRSKPANKARLSLHLLILRVRTADGTLLPPTELSARKVDLGIWESEHLAVLPCSWAWTSEALYFVLADRKNKINVIKTLLPSSENDANVSGSFEKLARSLELPESATAVTLEYGPPTVVSSYSTMLVGLGDHAVMVAKFTEEDLGGWVDAVEDS